MVSLVPNSDRISRVSVEPPQAWRTAAVSPVVRDAPAVKITMGDDDDDDDEDSVRSFMLGNFVMKLAVDNDSDDDASKKAGTKDSGATTGNNARA